MPTVVFKLFPGQGSRMEEQPDGQSGNYICFHLWGA